MLGIGNSSWVLHGYYLNGCYNALLLAAQAAALFPAHGLEHATANVVTAQPIPSGLLKVPAGYSVQCEWLGLAAPSSLTWHPNLGTYTVAVDMPPYFLLFGSGGSGMPYFSLRSAARSRYFICCKFVCACVYVRT
jgi:hypothetical protein